MGSPEIFSLSLARHIVGCPFAGSTIDSMRSSSFGFRAFSFFRNCFFKEYFAGGGFYTSVHLPFPRVFLGDPTSPPPEAAPRVYLCFSFFFFFFFDSPGAGRSSITLSSLAQRTLDHFPRPRLFALGVFTVSVALRQAFPLPFKSRFGPLFEPSIMGPPVEELLWSNPTRILPFFDLFPPLPPSPYSLADGANIVWIRFSPYPLLALTPVPPPKISSPCASGSSRLDAGVLRHLAAFFLGTVPRLPQNAVFCPAYYLHSPPPVAGHS